MKRRITAPREVLSELREDFSLCGKCKLCQAVMAQQCEEPRFWRNCPSGTRFRYEAYYASGKLEIARCLDLVEIEPDDRMRHALYTCMLCGSCEDRCYPVKQMHPLWVIQLLREQAVQDGWAPMEQFSEMLDNIEKTDNPYGVPARKRVEWEDGLDIKNALDEKVEYLLFVGDDYGVFPELAPRMKAVAKVLRAGGVEFGTLGTAEVSSGSALLMIGDRDYFETVAAANTEKIEESGAGKVITADPHAYTVLKEEYAKAIDIEVYHFSEIAAGLIDEGKLKLANEVKVKAVYHDPCRLGRRQGVFEAPRKVLEAMPGLELLEFERNLKNSLCCGGGGSVFFWEPEYVRWVTNERLFEADSVGAEAIVTSCPICVRMFESAASEGKYKLDVYDLAEVIEKAL
ncbi:MAG: (Fe-S)-binding protein [Actinobacteria bacterium]|nr:(Fe-S)-binding protein [Actinomycetota bacterium]MCG2820105.1 (Fe-S)-binding protein [Actinomycetes bacterium]MBU4219891.1 (Fe-S)-binding protein [Actinomycetota bacterium]MBU4359781.1 (Fe-S)-binding protein [Actinomycetota bacterium]MBU4392364.1 (Fe-S)-binding protein [Actinomycetota bacterium]